MALKEFAATLITNCGVLMIANNTDRKWTSSLPKNFPHIDRADLTKPIQPFFQTFIGTHSSGYSIYNNLVASGDLIR